MSQIIIKENNSNLAINKQHVIFVSNQTSFITINMKTTMYQSLRIKHFVDLLIRLVH